MNQFGVKPKHWCLSGLAAGRQKCCFMTSWFLTRTSTMNHVTCTTLLSALSLLLMKWRKNWIGIHRWCTLCGRDSVTPWFCSRAEEKPEKLAPFSLSEPSSLSPTIRRCISEQKLTSHWDETFFRKLLFGEWAQTEAAEIQKKICNSQKCYSLLTEHFIILMRMSEFKCFNCKITKIFNLS